MVSGHTELDRYSQKNNGPYRRQYLSEKVLEHVAQVCKLGPFMEEMLDGLERQFTSMELSANVGTLGSRKLRYAVYRYTLVCLLWVNTKWQE